MPLKFCGVSCCLPTINTFKDCFTITKNIFPHSPLVVKSYMFGFLKSLWDLSLHPRTVEVNRIMSVVFRVAIEQCSLRHSLIHSSWMLLSFVSARLVQNPLLLCMNWSAGGSRAPVSCLRGASGSDWAGLSSADRILLICLSFIWTATDLLYLRPQ